MDGLGVGHSVMLIVIDDEFLVEVLFGFVDKKETLEAWEGLLIVKSLMVGGFGLDFSAAFARTLELGHPYNLKKGDNQLV